MHALLTQMARNNAWANRRIYTTLADMDKATFHAPRPGFFGSLKEMLNHIHQVDLYYIDALEQGGRGRAVYHDAEHDTVAALAKAQADTDQRLIAYCTTLTTDTLSEQRSTQRKDLSTTERVDALLIHLFQHQIHHRGQAHVQIQHAGIASPQLDEFHLAYDRHPDAARFDA